MKRNGFLQWLCIIVLAVSATAAMPARNKKIVVAKDGSGDFTTITAALLAVPENSSKTTLIEIRNGVYKEKISIPASRSHIHLRGEDPLQTIITYDDYASKKDSAGNNIGTGGSTTFNIRCSDFTAENITFENSSGPVGQAVALTVGGDKLAFRNCRFIGFQDTIYTTGDNNRFYFYKCYIEGAVDYIFGGGTALFEQCELFCKRGGYITAASTKQGQPFGYVFSNCNITGSAAPKSIYLGRPWRAYANVVYLQCNMSEVVKPEGWNNWGNPSNEQTAIYQEYRTSGAGAQLPQRVPWSKQLNEEEFKNISADKVLNGWKPFAR